MRTKPAEWDQIIGTNLKGTILCTKSVSRYMIRQRYGRIINLSSVVGQTGNGLFSNPTGDMRSGNFLVPDALQGGGFPRQFQLGARLGF